MQIHVQARCGGGEHTHSINVFGLLILPPGLTDACNFDESQISHYTADEYYMYGTSGLCLAGVCVSYLSRCL